MSRLENYHDTIRNDLSILHEYKKPKRSLLIAVLSINLLIDTAVTLFAVFFGPSVSDQAIINKVQEDISKNRDIVHDFTHIYNDSSEIYKNIFFDMSRELVNLNESIFNIGNEQKTRENFDDVIHVATMLIAEHRNSLNTFLDIFSGRPQSLLKLIGFKEFVLNLREISNTIDDKHELPIDIEKENVIDIFNFCKVDATLEEQILKIKIDVPIIEKQKFVRYDITPIPAKINAELYILRLGKDSILTDKQNKTIRAIREEQLNECTEAKEKTYVCPYMPGIMNSIANSCVYKLFTMSNSTDETCVFDKIPFQNYVIHLTYNLYYFFLTEPANFNIDCENGTTFQLQLVNSSLVKIDNYCYLEQKIYEESSINIDTNTTMLLNLDSPNLEKQNSTGRKPAIIIEKHQTHLTDLAGRINQIVERSSEQVENILMRPWYFKWVMAGIPTITTMLSFYCLYVKYCRRP